MAELGLVLGGRYRLDQVLGQGGMATIFRATDAKLGREVAVKVLRLEYGGDAQFVERFRHEAQATASLSHPNIVAVYDYGTSPAGPYIVMEQVAGGDLSQALGEHGALPPTAVARIGQQVADGLAAAHARGLVHCDIKPSNILLSPDGRVQVADFGIAQAAAHSPATTSGITPGSVLYLSPEQARGEAANPASDIYSLGLVLYELLTGQRPFSGDSPAAVAVARLSGNVPSPMAARPDTPPPLDAIVCWCLAIDPSARPSASDLAAALARFIADPSGTATFGAASVMVAAAGQPLGQPAVGSSSQGVAGSTRQPPPDGPERAGSGPLAWMAAGLGLLVIVASAILLYLLLSGIGDPVPLPSPTPTSDVTLIRTPQLVGRPESEAIRIAARRGLVVKTDYVESETEVGQVIEQLPGPGVRVPNGSSIQVTVGTRVETVVVPDVSGIKEAAALERLAAAGIMPGRRFTAADLLPEGYVVSSDPLPGEWLPRGSTVDYVVSTGRARGSPAAAATLPLAPTIHPSGSPTPFPSQATTLVGDFLCLDLATARSHIKEAGLIIGTMIPEVPPPLDAWLVHGQLPKSGVNVPLGSNVDLWLKDPLEPCP